MSNTTAVRPTSKQASRAERRSAARARRLRRRLVIGGVTVAVVTVLVVLAVRADRPAASPLDDAAPSFELESTAGGTVSSNDLRGRDVLLYFSEGVGCDVCFYQQAMIEKEQQRLADAGLAIVPIVVNPAPDVRRELARFEITTPFLIDSDRSVSAAYDTIGRGHHADLPGHSFILVDRAGRMRWRLDDPSMYVEPAVLIRQAVAALGR
jgi:peroxiredoxin